MRGAGGIALLERACDGGAVKGCRALGLILPLSEDNQKKAFDFAKRGCDQNDGASCWILARDYSRGSGVGSPLWRLANL